jgi:hypothetical protein
MKLFSCQQKITFSIIFLLTPLFATSFFCKSALAGETNQSDKFFAFVNYTIVIATSNVNVGISLKGIINAEITQNYQPVYNSTTTTSSQSAYQWLKIELAKAYTNTAVIRGSISGGIQKINFDFFHAKPIIASKNINYKLFTKSVNVARTNDDKSEIEIIDKNLSTFTENFESFVSVFNRFSSPDKQLTISDVNTLIASANNLRKSMSSVGDDMKYRSAKNSSREQLINVKNMLTSLDNVTSFLEVLIPSLNEVSSSISLSE